MGGTDKLAVEIGGRPLLAWTLAALAAAPAVGRIVVVTAGSGVADVRPLTGCRARSSPWSRVATAARNRWPRASRRSIGHGAGRDAASSSSTTARARSSTPALVDAVIDATARHGAAIPIVPVAETLKRVEGGGGRRDGRQETLGTAQTPQGVRHGLLRAA